MNVLQASLNVQRLLRSVAVVGIAAMAWAAIAYAQAYFSAARSEQPDVEPT